jgi:hypothetical protein
MRMVMLVMVNVESKMWLLLEDCLFVSEDDPVFGFDLVNQVSHQFPRYKVRPPECTQEAGKSQYAIRSRLHQFLI